MKNWQVTNIDPLQAVFNPSTLWETTHMILACYMAMGFGVAAVYAFSMLHGKRDEYKRKGCCLRWRWEQSPYPYRSSAVIPTRMLADSQPAKFAAIKGLFHTRSGASLEIGGLADPQKGKVYYTREIPYGLSLLVCFDPNAISEGWMHLHFKIVPTHSL